MAHQTESISNPAAEGISAGGDFIRLIFGYAVLLNDIEELARGAVEPQQVVGLGGRLRNEALAWAYEADEILANRDGCPHCATDEEHGQPHALYVHPAPLAMYRVAASAQNVAQLLQGGEDADGARMLPPGELAGLFDDVEMVAFLKLQVAEPRYLEAIPGIYDWLGLPLPHELA
jgi:hypothetical protein